MSPLIGDVGVVPGEILKPEAESVDAAVISFPVIVPPVVRSGGPKSRSCLDAKAVFHCATVGTYPYPHPGADCEKAGANPAIENRSERRAARILFVTASTSR